VEWESFGTRTHATRIGTARRINTSLKFLKLEHRFGPVLNGDVAKCSDGLPPVQRTNLPPFICGHLCSPPFTSSTHHPQIPAIPSAVNLRLPIRVDHPRRELCDTAAIEETTNGDTTGRYNILKSFRAFLFCLPITAEGADR
jgi:hypothetical protein